MDITVSNVQRPESDKVLAQITVAAADVDKVIDKTYKDLAARYRFQGFRKGRAPRPVIDSILGHDAIMAQATSDLLDEAYPHVLNELEIVPVGKGSFGDEIGGTVAPKSDFTISFSCDVPPACELTSYEGVSIEMPPSEVTEAEIDQQIDMLQSYHTEFVDVDEDRMPNDDDFVVLDVENVEGAERLAGEGRLFDVDGPGTPEAIRDAVKEMKVGDEKDLEWTDTHQHGDHTHEEKVACKVTLKAIRAIHTPELDDEYCKKAYGYDTVEELRQNISDEIAADKAANLEGIKEDRCVEAAGALLDVEEIPEKYVNEVYTEYASEVLNNLQRRGISLDYYLNQTGLGVEQFVAELHTQADARARQSLALDAIASHFELEATDDDVKAEIERAAADSNTSETTEETLARLIADGNLPSVKAAIKRNKALEWLKENADVTIVDEVSRARKQAEEAADAVEDEAEEAADEAEEVVEEVAEAAEEATEDEATEE